MAVPKRKISKARRDKRRNSHWKLDLPGMSKCPKCGEKVYFDETVDPSDITCPSCGETFDCVCEDDEDECGCGFHHDKEEDDDDCECCHHDDKEEK